MKPHYILWFIKELEIFCDLGLMIPMNKEIAVFSLNKRVLGFDFKIQNWSFQFKEVLIKFENNKIKAFGHVKQASNFWNKFLLGQFFRVT